MAAPVTDALLREALRDRLDAVHVEVTDMSDGCGQAFSALVVSPRFQGLNSLRRHRLVNTALRQEIASIHAWTAKCQTPDEWAGPRSSETQAPAPQP